MVKVTYSAMYKDYLAKLGGEINFDVSELLAKQSEGCEIEIYCLVHFNGSVVVSLHF